MLKTALFGRYANDVVVAGAVVGSEVQVAVGALAGAAEAAELALK